MDKIILFLAFCLSLLLSLYGTPIAIKIANKYNILDHPDGKLKIQKKPTPYLGGLIVYFAFIFPISLLFDFNKELLGVLFAGSILLIVGLFDDLKALTPGIKFFFQIIATYILLKSGIYMKLVFLPNWVNMFLSFIWILIIINAFNIIDIMDGMAGTIAAISFATIFFISFFNQNFLIAIISISLTAACIGFTRFNWQTARIYLGDSGSMFIGMVLGALVIMNDYSHFNDYGFVSGFLILAIPLFDLTYVSLFRLFKGKSIFKGSKDHFTLRLKKKFSLSSSKTVLIVGLIQLTISLVILTSFYSNKTFTLISTIFILIFFILFGSLLARERME